MEITLITIFALGYLAITLEHSLKIDKLIPALAMMSILWALISVFHLPVFEVDTHFKELKPIHVDEILLHHLGKTAEIIIFLLGAMTIVEIIDYFNGFATIKSFIKTKSKKGLLIIFSIMAFILSAIIDNLTATIVLITILQKIIKERNTRLWFAGLIVIAANAGGAWSPIGDVTTTMLWIGNKVTTAKLIMNLLIPSLVCMVVPVLLASTLPAFKGDIADELDKIDNETHKYGAPMLYIGLSAIVFVPVFKTLTHLPPYIGMMLSLAVVATFAEYFSSAKFDLTTIDKEHEEYSSHSPVHSSLSKIELPSILFFLGDSVGRGGSGILGYCCLNLQAPSILPFPIPTLLSCYWESARPSSTTCLISGCQYGDVFRGTDRPPALAFYRLFCRYRWQHAHHRFGRQVWWPWVWSGLISFWYSKKDFLAGLGRISWRGRLPFIVMRDFIL